MPGESPRFSRLTTYEPPPFGYARTVCWYDRATKTSRIDHRHGDVDRKGDGHGAREHQSQQDLLGRVRRGRDGIRREDRQRELLGQPLLRLLSRRHRTAEQDALHGRTRTQLLPPAKMRMDPLSPSGPSTSRLLRANTVAAKQEQTCRPPHRSAAGGKNNLLRLRRRSDRPAKPRELLSRYALFLMRIE